MASPSSGRRVRSTTLAAGFAAATLCFANGAASSPVEADLGRPSASQPLHATVWLKRKDEEAFQRALKAIYQPGSPSFHHWMTPAQYSAYMPDQASLATVRDALMQSGLTIVNVAADGSSIDVAANAAIVERAFGAPVHRFQNGVKTFLATTARPALAGAPGALVGAITGLGTPRTRPFALRQTDQSTGRPVALTVSKSQPTAAASGSGSPLNQYLTDSCYHGNTVQKLYAAEGDVKFSGQRQGERLFRAGRRVWRLRLRRNAVACPLRAERRRQPRPGRQGTDNRDRRCLWLAFHRERRQHLLHDHGPTTARCQQFQTDCAAWRRADLRFGLVDRDDHRRHDVACHRATGEDCAAGRTVERDGGSDQDV